MSSEKLLWLLGTALCYPSTPQPPVPPWLLWVNFAREKRSFYRKTNCLHCGDNFPKRKRDETISLTHTNKLPIPNSVDPSTNFLFSTPLPQPHTFTLGTLSIIIKINRNHTINSQAPHPEIAHTSSKPSSIPNNLFMAPILGGEREIFPRMSSYGCELTKTERISQAQEKLIWTNFHLNSFSTISIYHKIQSQILPFSPQPPSPLTNLPCLLWASSNKYSFLFVLSKPTHQVLINSHVL